MISFESDYIAGAHPKVLARLAETNGEPLPGYGTDRYCDSAKEKIRAACAAPDADVELLVGGTQTNAAVISSLLRDWEGVIAAETGHIAVHEAGAVEFTGHRVLTLPQHDGKLDPAELARFLADFHADENREHMVWPGMVYLSWPTELGTLYSRAELTAISQLCRAYRIPLYADGARLGYGLMSPACDLTLPELAELCDVFTIGGTKVGALCGEAVVFRAGVRPPHFMNAVKKRGALLAKGRLLGVQFDALFTDGLYFDISRHVINLSEGLKAVLHEAGLPFYLESPTNQQFVILPNGLLARISKEVRLSFWEAYDEAHTVVRFAVGWSSTEADLQALAAVLKAAADA